MWTPDSEVQRVMKEESLSFSRCEELSNKAFLVKIVESFAPTYRQGWLFEEMIQYADYTSHDMHDEVLNILYDKQVFFGFDHNSLAAHSYKATQLSDVIHALDNMALCTVFVVDVDWTFCIAFTQEQTVIVVGDVGLQLDKLRQRSSSLG